MFRDAEVGDKVWSLYKGWGVIIGIKEGAKFPIEVGFGLSGNEYYSVDGKLWNSDLNPSLFWDEIKIVPPPPPKRKAIKRKAIPMGKVRLQAIKILIYEVMYQVKHPNKSTKSSNERMEKSLKNLGFTPDEIREIMTWG